VLNFGLCYRVVYIGSKVCEREEEKKVKLLKKKKEVVSRCYARASGCREKKVQKKEKEANDAT
jgi:hypothetical protein